MKMTITTTPTITQRIHHRKVLRLAAGKRSGTHYHPRSLALGSGKGRPALRTTVDASYDNSDDSGLGFDHHVDGRTVRYSDRAIWMDEVPEFKRRKLDLKVENEESNDGYCFPETMKMCKENNSIIRNLPCSGIQNLTRNSAPNINPTKSIGRNLLSVARRPLITGPITLTTQLPSSSSNGKVHLQIMCQPEQQHRARYQTEGSRGAVKDRTGNGFPIVKLIGYNKPALLQIFIGTDLGRVAPHMFYQACRVSGKNSTPCIEKKIDGTIVIEVELEPSKEMIATCDCVGILKERNVDVEHRFPEQLSPRSKKKSTKCRMVFRTVITNEDGHTETLQVCSQPIVCTQPPGVPEICKRSLTNCPVSGGLELFILGKNFLKDTKVVFQQQAPYDSTDDHNDVIWEEMVTPDKEFLQQTHLVCVVPAYMHPDIPEPVSVRLFVVSSGKNSEAHTFHYTPSASATAAPSAAAANGVAVSAATVQRLEANAPPAAPFLSKMLWQTGTSSTAPPKQELDLGMMPPPATLMPMIQRRSSTNVQLKTELLDENSQSENSMEMRRFEGNETSDNLAPTQASLFPLNPLIQSKMEAAADLNSVGVDLRMKNLGTVSDLANTQTPSLDTLRKFVVTDQTNMPLPTQTAQSVENYLTTLESNMNKTITTHSIKSSFQNQMTNGLLSESHLANQGLLTPNQILFNSQKTDANLIMSQQNLLLQNVTSVKTPQQELIIGNKSPLIGAQPPEILISASTDVLLNSQSQLITTNDLIIHSTPTEMVSPNLPPDVILNPTQSVLCHPTDTLLQVNSICTPLIQPNKILSPEPPLLASQPILTEPSSLLQTLKSPAVSVESIVLNAAVDYLETQKKISEITGVQTEAQEQILNTLLDARSNPTQETFVDSQTLLQNHTVDLLKLGHANEFLNPLDSKSDATQQQQQQQSEAKKNEEGMIPPALTNMSESDLISYINPSCFDQGTFAT